MLNELAEKAFSLPYQRFVDAQKHLAAIEAIDYFFAKEYSLILLDGLNNQSAIYQRIQTNCDQLFHLLLALSVSLREGHSCLPITVFASQRYGFSCEASGVVNHQGFQFTTSQDLHLLLMELAVAEHDNQAIVYHDNKLYLRRYFQFEQQISGFISQQIEQLNLDNKRLDNKQLDGKQDDSQTFDDKKITECLTLLFPEETTGSLHDIDWQKIAVANALNKSFTIIAGGPGTGKTYTVTKLLAAIIVLNEKKSLNIALVAPTGKAAQRLSESISQAKIGFNTLLPEKVLSKIPTESQTIHRLLGVIPNNPNFRHHQDNPLNIDVLLIDEVSMVDLPLMARVLRALPTRCKVILLGDAQQLPSVAAGSVLSDFTPSDTAQFSQENARFLSTVTGISNLPVNNKKPMDHLTYLTKSRRFTGDGGIGILSKAVIEGDNKKSWQLLQQAKENQISQLMFIDEDSAGNELWMKALIKQYYQPLQAAQSIEEAFNLLLKFRFLCATRQGDKGVEAINQIVESVIIGNKSTHQALYHAKPIMINENDYGLGLYNGDIGLLWQTKAGHLMAVFEQQDGTYKHILPSRLPHYETVYAMTIHKTQGSEFTHVAMILPANADNQLLTRELLYTGITRAKSQLTIQSKKSVWLHGVDNKVSRYSGLTF